MIEIFEDEIIPMVIKKQEFDFKGPALQYPFSRKFWNIKVVYVKGEMHVYSKSTRLLLRIYYFTEGIHIGEKAIRLVAWRNKQGKFIPANRCNKHILDWCTRSGIHLKDNFWL